MDELRELDVRVAEALGWKHYHSTRLPWLMVPPECESDLASDDPALVIAEIPDYSTDISAAWGLVERINGYIETREYSYGYSEVDWYSSDADEHYFGRGAKTPEAICRAFLAAMGKTEEG